MPTGSGRARKTAEKGKEKKVLEKKVLKLAVSSAEPDKPVEAVDPDELVFAFDIGTRTVVGVVGVREDARFKIIATDVVEHKSRAMLDGQIHDIEQVAAVAGQVKERLEARLGVKLRRVAIAAAGRVLKTCQVKVEKDVEAGAEIDQELVGSLEIEGIQRAQAMLDKDLAGEETTRFYCVGYSVINYYLDGYIISKLAGHKGKTIGADILATFLPHVVVDSLYTVMGRIGLEVSSLTLEPIAAINVAIPQDLRLLNLALVDIGAGTSDIALTKGGSVIAYAMAPIAGDEITEKISQQYLVDFNTAERIKISLSTKRESINFTDILKVKHTISAAEALEALRSSIETLGATIAQRILEYNHKSPNAVFLIGGGSQIPGLSEVIAGCLELPRDRVVVRGRDVIRDIKFSDKRLSGPESITPYGIAYTAIQQKGRDFLAVSVNGSKVKLFNSKKLNVSDALILVGFNPNQLIGRTGKSLSFTMNGEKRVVRGEYGKAAEIYVNGKASSLETVLKNGDAITIEAAQDGKNAEVKVLEAAGGLRKGKVSLNGHSIDISSNISINGRSAVPESYIKDGDSVDIYEIGTVEELLKATGIEPASAVIKVNGQPAGLDQILENSDKVEYSEIKQGEPEAGDFGEELPEPGYNDVTAGSGTVSGSAAVTPMGTASLAGTFVTVNGQQIGLEEGKTQYIFVDVFNYIDFDLTKPQGSIVLKLNGRQAAFTDIIGSGDNIEIYWQK